MHSLVSRRIHHFLSHFLNIGERITAFGFVVGKVQVNEVTIPLRRLYFYLIVHYDGIFLLRFPFDFGARSCPECLRDVSEAISCSLTKWDVNTSRFSPVRCEFWNPLCTTYHEEASFDFSKKTFQLKLRLFGLTGKKKTKNKNSKNHIVTETLAQIAYFVIHLPLRGRSVQSQMQMFSLVALHVVLFLPFPYCLPATLYGADGHSFSTLNWMRWYQTPFRRKGTRSSFICFDSNRYS